MREICNPVVIKSVRRLLLVDDEDPQVWLLSRILKREGFEVSGFSNARQAVESFRLNPYGYDAVVSDLTMPGYSGFDLAKEVLAIRPDVPVVLTTGYIREEDQVEASAIGVRRLLLKGHTMDDFGSSLKEVLRVDDALSA